MLTARGNSMQAMTGEVRPGSAKHGQDRRSDANHCDRQAIYFRSAPFHAPLCLPTTPNRACAERNQRQNAVYLGNAICINLGHLREAGRTISGLFGAAFGVNPWLTRSAA